MTKTLLSLLAGGLLLGAMAAPADAPKDFKPVAVVSISSYDELLGDVELLGKISDNPHLGKGLEAVLKLLTKNQGLAGLDKSRPLGAVVQTDGRKFTGYAFLPVTDLKRLLWAMENFVGKTEDAGQGVLKIKGKRKTFYLKQNDAGWAFVCERRELLERTPDNPLDLLGGIGEKYDVAVRLYAGNVPKQHRQKFIAKMHKDAQRDLRQRPGEPEHEYAVRKKLSEQLFRLLIGAVQDLEEVTVGWSLDHRTGRTFAEVSLTAREGTETARQVAHLRETKSNFGGFLLPDAAVTGNWTGRLPKGKIAMLTTVIEALRTQALKDIDQKDQPEKKAEGARKFVGELADLLQQTVDGGRVDGGMAVVLKPQSVTVLVGGYVADGAKLDKLARVLAQAARADNPAVGKWVKLDAGRHGDVRLHTVSVPIPPDAKDRDKVVGLIGEKLEVVVGIGTQSVYMAAGRDAMRTLKQVIEKSAAEAGKTVPPVRLSLSLGKLAGFIAASGEQKDRPKAALIAAELAKSEGGDRVKLLATPIARGVKYRLEVEEGILKLLGRLSTIARPEGS